MLVDNYSYVPMTLKEKDKINVTAKGEPLGKFENATYNQYSDKTTVIVDGKKVNYSKNAIVAPVRKAPTVIAKYMLNPSNAKLDLVPGDEVVFNVIPNADYIVTRAEASKNFAVSGTVASIKDGILSVEVAVDGLPATREVKDGIVTGGDMSLAALQIVNTEGVTITSDYATIMKTYYDQFRIAEPKALTTAHWGTASDKKAKKTFDVHYRRATIGVNKKDEKAAKPNNLRKAMGAINLAPLATTDDKLADVRAQCDTAVAYDGSIDLATIVAAHVVTGGSVLNATSTSYNDDKDVNCGKELSAEALENIGLHFEFDVVKNFLVGKNLTDQAEFVTLDGSIFTPKVFQQTDYARAAVGRTPIIRVRLMDGKTLVQAAYIKIFIADVVIPEEDLSYEINLTTPLKFTCEGASVTTTVEEMNYLYNYVKLSKTLFHENTKAISLAGDKTTAGSYNNAIWNAIVASVAEKDRENVYNANKEIGKISEVASTDDEGGATKLLKWTVDADDLWEAVSLGRTELEHHVAYVKTSSAGQQVVVIVKLTAKVADLKQAYDVTPADYYTEYWVGDVTRYNVAVPELEETDPTNCVFVNDINASFVTWTVKDGKGTPGVLKLDEAITKIDYFFTQENRASSNVIKLFDPQLKRDTYVEFVLSQDNTKLYAYQHAGTMKSYKASDEEATEINGNKVVYGGYTFNKLSEKIKNEYGEECDDILNYHGNLALIATIDNTGSTKPNTITLNKESALAKKLLNADQYSLIVFIGAKGQVCNKENKEVKITFNGKTYFKAQYTRPVNITDVAKDYFIDGVDIKEAHSYIAIDKLVAPVDWRNREFDKYVTKKVKDATTGVEIESVENVGHTNYWGFYGPFSITVDTEDVTCKMSGKIQNLPATIELKQIADTKYGPEKVDADGNKYQDECAYGFLTYKNNSTTVQSDFEIYLNVTVNYGWGSIYKTGLTVPVKATKEASDK